MDPSKHSKTLFVVGAEIDKRVNERTFKNLNVLLSPIYEVGTVKPELNHNHTCWILHSEIWEAHNATTVLNFFQLFFDSQKYELIKLDTGSLYVALSEDKVEELIRPEMKLM